jgi:hypothetical protein
LDNRKEIRLKAGVTLALDWRKYGISQNLESRQPRAGLSLNYPIRAIRSIGHFLMDIIDE